MPSEIPVDQQSIFFIVGGGVRARTDEGHVAAQDVEQLGQLIEARPAKESAESRDSGVVALGLQSEGISCSIIVHAPELVDQEAVVVETVPLLAEQYRTR